MIQIVLNAQSISEAAAYETQKIWVKNYLKYVLHHRDNVCRRCAFATTQLITQLIHVSTKHMCTIFLSLRKNKSTFDAIHISSCDATISDILMCCDVMFKMLCILFQLVH